MSEYQRYEFMTIDRPLTRVQLEAVNDLSSHIEASSTHALVEYNWGDFKHNPIDVLYEYFDGFLYWANWGSPRLALRFPHGILPSTLINNYDFDGFVNFTLHPDYDILEIHFSELQAPNEWTNYELGDLIAIRDELMEGDLRSLYIAWLVTQRMLGAYEDDEEDEDSDTTVPPVPPAFGTLTAGQKALAELLQVSQELLVAAGRHSQAATSSTNDDVALLVELLSPERRNDYLVRLAHNEPGLSRLLVKELRELSQNKTSATPPTGEHVTYATMLAESYAIKAQLLREQREQEQLAHQRRLQYIHDRQDDYWHQVDQAVVRGTSAGYDQAAQLLIELRSAAAQFKETQQFQDRFRAWVRPHLRRPAFVKRLQAQQFTVPVA